MAQKAIITDLNRCVGCLACSTACKTANGVAVGEFWIKVLRVGPYRSFDEGGKRPRLEMNYLPVSCQHCTNPPCIDVCPTGATYKRPDGTVQIDPEVCIGCQACVPACPYGTRSFNADVQVVEKCTMCQEQMDRGELPQCVAQCGGRARWFGDLDEGFESFVGPHDPAAHDLGASYDDVHGARTRMLDYVRPFEDADVHTLSDDGNGPCSLYILRDREWRA